MANDFDDVTSPPDPTPKKRYRFDTRFQGSPLPWPAGMTFQQALAAALPLAMRQKTNATDFVISIEIEAREV